MTNREDLWSEVSSRSPLIWVYSVCKGKLNSFPAQQGLRIIKIIPLVVEVIYQSVDCLEKTILMSGHSIVFGEEIRILVF